MKDIQIMKNMMKYWKLILVTKVIKYAVIFALFSFSGSANAAPEQDIKNIESYLNGLTTARSKFVQIDPDGIRTTGTFYLNRPGKLRFEYDAPVNDFVVADGSFIYFYDAAVQEQSNAPIGQTLADFILRPNLNLSKDIIVTDIKRAAGLLQITLVQSADPDAGELSLGFTEDPLLLQKWRVVDPQGAITEISLSEMETGIDLKDSLFFYHNPSRKVQRYNQ